MAALGAQSAVKRQPKGQTQAPKSGRANHNAQLCPMGFTMEYLRVQVQCPSLGLGLRSPRSNMGKLGKGSTKDAFVCASRVALTLPIRLVLAGRWTDRLKIIVLFRLCRKALKMHTQQTQEATDEAHPCFYSFPPC